MNWPRISHRESGSIIGALAFGGGITALAFKNQTLDEVHQILRYWWFYLLGVGTMVASIVRGRNR